MGKSKDLGHLAHIVAYDSGNHITVPAGITMHTNQLVASQAWVTTALGSYALSSSLGSYVPTSRTITINGTTYDLSANREWNITSMIYPAAGIPLSTGTAWGASITNNSANWNTAYGWGNHASAGYVPGARTITINGTSFDLTANRSWTISGSDATKLPLAGGVLTGNTYVNAGYSFISNGYNNNGGFAMNNGGQYWGLMWNFANNDWRLGRGSVTAQNGWNLRWDSSDNVFINQHLYLNNNYGSTIVGAYSASRYQGVFAMGDAYKLPLDGTSPGSLYGLAWSHPNAGGVAGNLNTHGLLVMENGTFLAAISGSIRARDDMRAPIFYDSNDTGYYLDLNGTSNIYKFSGATMSRNNLNRMHTNSPWDTRANQSAPYQNGTMGWGTYDFNIMTNWGSGFTDTWSNPANAPGGSSHYVGMQSMHHSSENSYNFYGWQMTCAGEADNRFFWRSSWNVPRGWVEMIHSGNIGSQSVSYASSSGSLSGFDKTNPSFGAVYANNWFRAQGDCGLYMQDYGAHFRTNFWSSYGTFMVHGYNKNGYGSINIYDPQGYSNNLMFENGNGGMYQENGGGWGWYYNRGSDCFAASGSDTNPSFRFIANGSSQMQGDFYASSYASFGSTTEWGIGTTQYHGSNTGYNWRDWGGWGGYWWSRNGGDMIMNLYAVYAVTGSISDIRYKKDVEALPYGLNEIMQLNPIKYHYNLPKESMIANDPDYFLGFSAQEVQALIPEAVHEKINEDVESMKGMLAITYDELIPVTVQAIKEQQVMIHNQNIRIQKLEALVTQLLNN